MKHLYLLLLIIPISLFSQENDSYKLDYNNSKVVADLCSQFKSNSFTSNAKADEALGKILSVVGASKRFIIAPCENINNALATINDGIRYILYDPKFLNSISDTSNYWANMSILAHEVGHHINGHTLGNSVSAYENKMIELEADEFSGFVMQKLGGTIKQATDAIASISSKGDDSYSSHPNRTRRIAAITKGFNNALDNQFIKEDKLDSWEEYYYRGLKSRKNGNHAEAIKDLTESIRLKPSLDAYYYRAVSKDDLDDYSGAQGDYFRALEINPKDDYARYRFGRSKHLAGDLWGTISELTKLQNNKTWDSDYLDIWSYYYIGVSFYNKDYYKKALEYFDYLINEESEALIEHASSYISKFYNYRGLVHQKLDSFNLAIVDFNKAAESDPKSAIYFENIADTYSSLKEYDKAIKYYNKAILLDNNKTSAYAWRSYTYEKKEDYFSALFDMNEAIKLSPNKSYYYLKRGEYKFKLNKKEGACEDWLKGQELGSTVSKDKLIENCGYTEEYFYTGADYFSLAKKEYNSDEPNYAKAIELFEKAKGEGSAYYSEEKMDGWIVYCLWYSQDYSAALALLKTLKDSKAESELWKLDIKIKIKYSSKDYQAVISLGNKFIKANNLNPDLANTPLNEDFIKANLDEVNYIFSKIEDSYTSLEQYSKAIELLDKYLKIGKATEDQYIIDYSYYRLASAKFKSARYLDALQDITESIKLTPLDYNNYELSGDIKLAAGAKNQACIDYKKALDIVIKDKGDQEIIDGLNKIILENCN